MKRSLKVILLISLVFLISMQTLSSYSIGDMSSQSFAYQKDLQGVKYEDVLDDESFGLDVEDYSIKYSLSDQGLSQWTDTSSSLSAAEFGNRSDDFDDRLIQYLPTNETTNTTVNIPTGVGWEAYKVETEITGLTENRTWHLNP